MDYYTLLGVSKDASEEEIRRAFREKIGPAQNSSDRTLYSSLNDAFSVLKDAEKRLEYDNTEIKEKTNMDSNATVAMNATVGMGGPSEMGMGIPLPMLPCGNATESGAAGTFCSLCGLLVGSGECPVKGGATGVALLMPFLKDTTGREFRLRIGENSVGREGADIMLPDKSVSRGHAKLIVADGNRVTLEEMGSTNGSKHNNQPVLPGRQAFLSDGDRLRFGSVDMTITIPAVAAKDPKSIGARGPVAALPSAKPTTNLPPARLIGADGTVFVLKAIVTTLGRKPSNDIVLTGDSFVSGSHGQLTFADGIFSIMDVGSTNGSKINGQKLEANAPQKVEDGDTIQLGNTLLNFHIG